MEKDLIMSPDVAKEYLEFCIDRMVTIQSAVFVNMIDRSDFKSISVKFSFDKKIYELKLVRDATSGLLKLSVN